MRMITPPVFPDHPHRGFETVTYMMAGAFTHRDSKGNEGHLTAGSVQWDDRGKRDHPQRDARTNRRAGLGLPALAESSKKIQNDRTQVPGPGLGKKLPVVDKDGIWVKILAGEYAGVKSPGKSFTPFTYFDVKLKPGSVFNYPAPTNENTFIYVIDRR